MESSEIDLDTVMDEVSDFHLDFSNYSYNTTTPTSDDDAYCNWNICSPLIDFQSFNVGQHNFHDFIDFLIDEESLPSGDPRPDHATMEEEEEEEEEEESIGGVCNSFSVNEEDDDGDRKGLRLVHLLMAAAEALTGTNKSHDLAWAILVRLKELVSLTNGTNMERLAAYFTDALQSILNGTEGSQNNTTKHWVITGPHFEDCQTDMLAAFQLLQDMSPYVKFAHFTANQAIIELAAHERRVHIVDYDIMEGAQWASLMQALSTRKDGLPGPHLRITALSRTGSRGIGRRSFGTIQETGRRLTAFAASVGQPFTFHQCKLDSGEMFRPSSVKLVRGEALVFNCMLHLPQQNYRANHSVTSFLNSAKKLSPKLVTLVEEELGPNEGFVGLFMDSLHRYSALYDSLEAGFPMQRWARSLVERVFLGPRIMGSVAQLYRTGEVYEEKREWGEWLRTWGFRGVPMSHANYCQAKLLLGLFNDGYRVEELSNNKLVLAWKLRRLFSASVWTCMSEDEF